MTGGLLENIRPAVFGKPRWNRCCRKKPKAETAGISDPGASYFLCALGCFWGPACPGPLAFIEGGLAVRTDCVFGRFTRCWRGCGGCTGGGVAADSCRALAAAAFAFERDN